jgi:hypothetical protein
MLCCKAVYGGRLWRPALNLEFARLVQQSLGTSALFLSYVLKETLNIVDYNMYLQTTVIEAAECSTIVFSSAQFVFGALRELSVFLCKWNHQQDCAVAGFLRGLWAAASSVVLFVHLRKLVMRLTSVVCSGILCSLVCRQSCLFCRPALCVPL